VSDDVTADVLAAEDHSCAAIAAEDWESLDEIVADDFRYTHSNGKTEDKASWNCRNQNAPASRRTRESVGSQLR
jgi:hypothetical protein